MKKNLNTVLEAVALSAGLAFIPAACGDDTGTNETSATTATAGCPTAGCPTAGCPTAGCPTAGCPTAGCPTAGCPTAGCPTATTTGSGDAGFCGLTCESAADCAMGGNEADWACTDGFCEYIAALPACDDTTCPAAIGGACADVDGNNICTFPCTDGGGECDALMLECTGADDAGNSICVGAPCGGVAEGEACEIAGFGQLGTCTDGVCSCADDAECTAEGYACNG